MQKSLSEYRREAGFRTQKMLADKIGIRRNAVARWELGHRYPRPPMLPTIAQALNITEGQVIASITAAKNGKPDPQPTQTAV